MTKNAIDLLKQDHDTVRKLLDKLVETTARAGKTRRELIERIGHELRVHAKIEEQIFYPALREAGETEAQEMYFEAMEEHRAVEELVLPDLENTEPESDEFSGRAKVLKELVEHHAEEEESKMFKLVKKMMSAEQLRELGERMSALKKELQQAYAS